MDNKFTIGTFVYDTTYNFKYSKKGFITSSFIQNNERVYNLLDIADRTLIFNTCRIKECNIGKDLFASKEELLDYIHSKSDFIDEFQFEVIKTMDNIEMTKFIQKNLKEFSKRRKK